LIDGLVRTDIVLVLFWIACAVVGVHTLLFFIGRVTNRYVASNRSEPNPPVNADEPVHVFNLATTCGGAVQQERFSFAKAQS
jgi:hypothetical protein